MKKQKNYGILLLVLILFAACNTTEKAPFIFTGTIEGATEGEVILYPGYRSEIKPDTAFIKKDGKFSMTGNYPEASLNSIFININNKRAASLNAYIVNGEMTLTANINDLKNAKIKGGQLQNDYIELDRRIKKANDEFIKKHNYSELQKQVLFTKTPDPETVKKYSKIASELKYIPFNMRKQFVKENPASEYSLILVSYFASGKKIEKAEEFLSMLDPKFNDTKIVKDLRKKAKELTDAYVGIENIVQAENINYTKDKKFNGKAHKNYIYLAIFENDNICALNDDGSIHIISSDGKEISSFIPEFRPKYNKPKTIAVDKDDNIYVFTRSVKTKKIKIRGKVRKQSTLLGNDCSIYSTNGEKKKSFLLSNVQWASGSRVVDDKIIVADVEKAKISIFDNSNGELISELKNMRPCCSTFDITVNDKNEILVANLGAFRVQSYDFSGKQIFAFGKRGKAINDFQGCCNPVSVAYLSNGAIVTTEKGPTRVKVYSKTGAKQIQGIEDLVKGCAYIPMVVDSNDNLFLASKEKGLVKCIPVK